MIEEHLKGGEISKYSRDQVCEACSRTQGQLVFAVFKRFCIIESISFW